MIHLAQVTKDNYEACLVCKVSNEQVRFVADNCYSLVQAAYEPKTFPLAIYNDDVVVGMLLYDDDPEIPGWSLSRFMIDQKHQYKGYGKKALEAFLSYFYHRHPKADLYTSAEVDNDIAIHLYESFGFQKRNTFSYEHQGTVYHEVRMVKKAESNEECATVK